MFNEEPGRRSNMKGDIERCFPDALVRENEGIDYLYRASILREQVVDVIRDMVTDIDYPSFKGSLTAVSRGASATTRTLQQ